MKKLVFAFAAIVAVSFAACGNKTEQAAAPVDADSIEEVVEDSLQSDSIVAGDSTATADSTAAAQ